MAVEKDLKAQNRASLTAIYVSTFFLLALAHWSVEEAFAFTSRLAKHAGVMAIITGFGAVLSDSLSNSAKHILVFFRFHNVLPGHRCRTLCEKDPRLSIERLEKRWPELFAQDMEERTQNTYWYKEIYTPVKDTLEILQAHRSFLLYRDAASGLFILLIGLLVWRVIAVFTLWSSLGVRPLLLLVGVILLLCLAGRQSGNRMVTNAVAVALGGNRQSAMPGQ